MVKIGYVRVSTLVQHTERQEIVLREVGVERFFIEKVSGKTSNRPQLKKVLDYAREGDVLYIESIFRLVRSAQDLLAIVEQL